MVQKKGGRRKSSGGSRLAQRLGLTQKSRRGRPSSAKPAKASNKPNQQRRPKRKKASSGFTRSLRAFIPFSNPSKRPAKRRKAKVKISILRRMANFIYWGLVASVWAVVVIVGVLVYYAANLPPASQWRVPERGHNIRIVDAQGIFIANRGGDGGTRIRLDQMPPHLVDALISTEDRRFRSHFGLDPIGLSRAVVRNLISMRFSEGGSTITQQLSKNLFFKFERSLDRKMKELVMALWLEANFSKDEILELYFNRVYFGNGAYGIDAAASRYFQKRPWNLNIAESATLVGLLKAPNRYSPNVNPERSRQRAELVIEQMRNQGYISTTEAGRAFSNPTRSYPSRPEYFGRWSADWVAARVQEVVGDAKDDIIVETTLDQPLQINVEGLLQTAIESNQKSKKVGQGAIVIFDRVGAVLAVAGGRSYRTSQFNRAVHAQRQPGSSFKPLAYLAAIEAGMTPETIRQDQPIRIGRWQPKNYDGKFRGAVNLSDSLALSLNTVAASLVNEIGASKVISIAKRLGISSPLKAQPAIALGAFEVSPLELTAAYVPIANGGYRAVPHVIRSIRTEKGDVLYQRSEPKPRRLISSLHVAMMNEMMANAIHQGTGRKAYLGRRPAGGKTGTTQNSRDAWFVGYTAQRVAGVWMGNDDSQPMKGVTGGNLPALLWRDVMRVAHHDLPVTRLPGVSIHSLPQETAGSSENEASDLPVPPADLGDEPRPSGISVFLKQFFGDRKPE